MSERTFLLPDVGEGLVEAEIVTWKVAVGDVVVLNQPLVDIETAKAIVELPSPFAGVIVALHGDVGDLMQVGEALVVVDDGAIDGTAYAPTEANGDEEGRTAVLVGYGVANEDGVAARRHRRRGSIAPPGEPPVSVSVPVEPDLESSGASPRSTPPVRLYAKQHGVDLAVLEGTGRAGLITRDDVERAFNGSNVTPLRRAPVSGPTSTSRFVGRDLESWATGPKEERIAVKGVLRSMSDAMVQSAFSAPHAAVWVSVDATRTVELLASLKQHPTLAGVRLSPLTIGALAFCDAARHFPGINSSFDAANNEVVVRRVVNLGIAADTPRGLVVPNIKSADRMDLVEMAEALDVLVAKARAGTTTPDEMIGTTLTITNVGPFAVDAAVPILPPGTGAILVIGQIKKAPWVVDDQVAVRHVLEISMAFDHRQIDGAMASAVLAHVGRYFSDPAPALIAR